MLNSPLKLEDGQIYLSMKEYVVFVRFILEMNFIFFLCANILKSPHWDINMFEDIIQ